MTRATLDLASLKPTPWRDFTMDPMNEEWIDFLAASIREHGWWGGIVVRETESGERQIIDGHMRREALLRTGATQAERCDVIAITDLDAIRFYVGCNAGDRYGAMLNGICAGLRMVIHATLTDGHLLDAETRKKVARQMLRNFERKKAGEALEVINPANLVPLFAGVRALHRSHDQFTLDEFEIRRAFSILRDAGDYGRIVREAMSSVQDAIAKLQAVAGVNEVMR